MKQPSLTTILWLCFTAAAFALGWHLKPQAAVQGGSVDGPEGFSLTHGNDAFPKPSAAGAKARVAHAAEAEVAAAQSTPLTSASIADLGQQFRSATDPLVKRELFAKLLAGLTADNALEIREQIAHLDSSDPAFRDFHFAWGKVGGKDAVMHGAETDKSDMAPTLAGWASSDPAAAKAWFDSLEANGKKGLNREQLKEAYVHGLAIANPALASDFVLSLGAAGDPRAKQMMGIVTEKMLTSSGTNAATNWASGLPDGDLRNHAFYEIARTQVRQDPAGAAAWATPLAGEKGGSAAVYGISSEWGARDGASTAKWLDTLSGDQSKSYGPAFAGWAKSDPLAASQRIVTMPPSENRNNAIGGMVYSYRWEDPVSAITWANQITDLKGRQEVLSLSAEAYLKKDPAGATAWIPNSGLPAATQQRLLGGKR
jgi:hypothetical protein